jgi:hypothetical protein
MSEPLPKSAETAIEPARETRITPTPAPRVVQHVAVQVADKIGDAVGTLCITYLCATGKLSGIECLAGILALLGGLESLRRLGIRMGAATGGAAVALLCVAVPAVTRVTLAAAALSIGFAGCVR